MKEDVKTLSMNIKDGEMSQNVMFLELKTAIESIKKEMLTDRRTVDQLSGNVEVLKTRC